MSRAAEEPAGTIPSEVVAELAVLTSAVGGWRGMLDSGLPSAVFVVAYLVSGHDLRAALISATVAGGLILSMRILRRERTNQAFAGFVGLLVSAYVARQTGRAADFFLIGLLTNAAFFVVLSVSVLVRWPLAGLAVGALRGDPTGWRDDPPRRRVFTVATWAWAGVFALRLAVEVPLYGLGWVGPLGVAKLVLGLPLYLLVAYLTYRMLAPTLREPSAD